ncbi:MAG TPA: hypothetical protein VFR75_03225 [Solirubrobacterales bacterium]|nr:hypothetical protein [Solirubrobacterales bacterium]
MDTPPRLETPDQIRRSEERDRALAQRAQRRREELSVDRARFELTRDKIVFGVQLALAAVGFVGGVVALFADPGLVPLVLAGGGISSLAAIRRRRSDEKA